MRSSLNHLAPLLFGTQTKRSGPANQGSRLSAAGVEPAPPQNANWLMARGFPSWLPGKST
jgi:hypothetical protein